MAALSRSASVIWPARRRPSPSRRSRRPLRRHVPDRQLSHEQHTAVRRHERPFTGSKQLNGTVDAGRVREAAVGAEQRRRADHLGQRDVGRVIGAEVMPQRP